MAEVPRNHITSDSQKQATAALPLLQSDHMGFEDRHPPTDLKSEIDTAALLHTTAPSRSPAHGGSGHPSLQQLDRLPVTAKWYRLGLQLGVRSNDLDVVESNYPRDADMCKIKMFAKWLSGDTNPTYEKLVRALVIVEERNLAESVCSANAIPLMVLDITNVPKPLSLPDTPQPPECVATYTNYLKGKYKQMPLLPVWDWPPSTGRQYTKLSLIERDEKLPTTEQTKKMEDLLIYGEVDEIMKMRRERGIEISDLFSPETSTHRPIKVLMDGIPGIGKTTISRKICKDWACGILLQKYHIVVLLDLRNQDICETKSIKDLFPTNSPQVKDQVIEYIQTTCGKHTLFIFDGYDELNREQRTPNSIFMDIIEREALHNCSVLVTSRPYASDFLQSSNCIDRHVEVIGFTQEQIQSCILQTIPDQTKAEGLIKALEENMEIMSLCYTPLHCIIMLYVYKQDNCTLPNTLTKLFDKFIVNALKRSARNNQKLLKSVHSLDKLPDLMKSQFKSLCKLAYDSFLKNKVVFSNEDLEFAFPDCDNETELESNLFGLITESKSFTSTGKEVNYHFLHLSIQEFLVAKWATLTLSDEKQAVFIKDYLQCTQYRNVLKFLAGISQLKGRISDTVFPKPLYLSIPPSLRLQRQMCESFADRSDVTKQDVASHSIPLTEYVDVTEGRSVSHHIPMRKYVNVTERSFSHLVPMSEHSDVTKQNSRKTYKSSVIILLTQLIYESQNFAIFPRLLHLIDNQELLFSFHRLLPSECIPLAHFLARVEHRWKVLTFHFCALTDHSLEILQKVSSDHYGGAQYEEVQLNYNGCSLTTKLSLLPKISLFYNTKSVIIEGLQYPDGVPGKWIELHRILDMQCLASLRISVQSVPAHHLLDYLYIFSQFTDVLKSNKTLKMLSYEHPHNSGCSVFECTAAALKQNSSLHLSSQFKIQKGCQCELSTALQQGWKMCKRIAFHLFQLPCMEHLQAQLHKSATKRIYFQHETLFKNCDSPACASIARKVVLQTFDNFIKNYVSEINLYHDEFSDINNYSEHSAAEPTKNKPIRTPSTDASKAVFRCAVNVVEATTSFHVTSLITKLSLLPRMVLFNETTTVSIHNLKYLDGIAANQIELQRILDMKCLTNLRICVTSVAYQQLTEYLSIFTNFTNALKSNENLLRLLYEHPHTSDCSVFECTAAALKQNSSLHLNSQFKIQKGYPCELSMTVQGFEMCKTVAFYLFQLPCMKHVKQVNVQHKAVFRTCDNQTCCSFSREGVLQAFEKFLVETVSKIDLVHSDTNSLAEYSTKASKKYSISELFSDGSDNTFSCTVNVMKLNTYFHVTNLITKLSLLPRIALFSNTTTVSIHNLKYPEGVPTKHIKLQRILDMRCLINLRISVQSVSDHHRDDYLSMFTQFTCALRINKTIEKLLYEHPHSSDCSVFECTATVLKQNSLLHLSSRYMIQMGYPCRLSGNELHWDMHSTIINDVAQQVDREHRNVCSTIAVHFFQVPCINHVKKLDFHNTTFKSCNLCSTTKDSVLHALNSFLKTSNTISELNLSHCRLTDEDSELIATGLAENKSVVNMNISGNELSAEAMLMLLKSNSTLSYNMCDQVGGPDSIMGGVQTLCHILSEPGTMIATNTILLLSIPGVGNVKIISTGLQSLSILLQDADASELTAEGCACLFKMLNQRTSMKVRLSLMNNIRSISNGITSGAAVSIFTSLHHNTSLEELDLSMNKQLTEGDSEAVGNALERMLKDNAGISVLMLKLCGIGEHICENIGMGLARNKTVRILNVSTNSIHSSGAVSIFAALEQNTSLEELDLSRNKQLTEGDAEAMGCALERMLTVNKGIQTLKLWQCGISDIVGKHIGVGLTRNMSLRVLNIGHGSIHSGGAKSIFKSLEHNSSLEELDLSWNWYLTKDDSEAVSYAIKRMLTFNKRLQTLNLQQCGICDQIGNKIGVGLGGNKSLRVLNISHSSIRSGGAISIFKSLEHNASLEVLDLSWNWFAEGDSEGVGCALKRMLTVNTGIKVLKLAHCRISDCIGKKIGKGLGGNKSLKVFDLSWNSICSDGAVHIFNSLKHNASMEELDLSQNEHLADDSEQMDCALETMLAVNKAIQSLNLHQCGVSDQITKSRISWKEVIDSQV